MKEFFRLVGPFFYNRLFILFLLMFCMPVFSQQKETQKAAPPQAQPAQTQPAQVQPSQEQSEKQAKNKNAPVLSGGIFISMGSAIQINKAPLPSGSMTLFTFGIGGRLDFAKWFSFMPHMQFYGNYYLWAYENALPSPPENRTAYVPALLFDLPICFVVPVKQSQFSVGLGLALYARVGFLTKGVPSTEQEDVDKINNFFWSNMHFFMPSFQIAWDFDLPGKTRAGIYAKYFFPTGTFVDPNAWSKEQEHLVTVGIRFTFNLG